MAATPSASLFLDFLFGTQNVFNQSTQQQEAYRGPITGVYAQDTWHATRRLTVIAGLRWAPNFFPHDYFHRGSIFSMACLQGRPGQHRLPHGTRGLALLRRSRSSW